MPPPARPSKAAPPPSRIPAANTHAHAVAGQQPARVPVPPQHAAAAAGGLKSKAAAPPRPTPPAAPAGAKPLPAKEITRSMKDESANGSMVPHTHTDASTGLLPAALPPHAAAKLAHVKRASRTRMSQAAGLASSPAPAADLIAEPAPSDARASVAHPAAAEADAGQARLEAGGQQQAEEEEEAESEDEQSEEDEAESASASASASEESDESSGASDDGSDAKAPDTAPRPSEPSPDAAAHARGVVPVAALPLHKPALTTSASTSALPIAPARTASGKVRSDGVSSAASVLHPAASTARPSATSSSLSISATSPHVSLHPSGASTSRRSTQPVRHQAYEGGGLVHPHASVEFEDAEEEGDEERQWAEVDAQADEEEEAEEEEEVEEGTTDSRPAPNDAAVASPAKKPAAAVSAAPATSAVVPAAARTVAAPTTGARRSSGPTADSKPASSVAPKGSASARRKVPVASTTAAAPAPSAPLAAAPSDDAAETELRRRELERKEADRKRRWKLEAESKERAEAQAVEDKRREEEVKEEAKRVARTAERARRQEEMKKRDANQKKKAMMAEAQMKEREAQIAAALAEATAKSVPKAILMASQAAQKEKQQEAAAAASEAAAAKRKKYRDSDPEHAATAAPPAAEPVAPAESAAGQTDLEEPALPLSLVDLSATDTDPRTPEEVEAVLRAEEERILRQLAEANAELDRLQAEEKAAAAEEEEARAQQQWEQERTEEEVQQEDAQAEGMGQEEDAQAEEDVAAHENVESELLLDAAEAARIEAEAEEAAWQAEVEAEAAAQLAAEEAEAEAAAAADAEAEAQAAADARIAAEASASAAAEAAFAAAAALESERLAAEVAAKAEAFKRATEAEAAKVAAAAADNKAKAKAKAKAKKDAESAAVDAAAETIGKQEEAAQKERADAEVEAVAAADSARTAVIQHMPSMASPTTLASPRRQSGVLVTRVPDVQDVADDAHPMLLHPAPPTQPHPPPATVAPPTSINQARKKKALSSAAKSDAPIPAATSPVTSVTAVPLNPSGANAGAADSPSPLLCSHCGSFVASLHCVSCAPEESLACVWCDEATHLGAAKRNHVRESLVQPQAAPSNAAPTQHPAKRHSQKHMASAQEISVAPADSTVVVTPPTNGAAHDNAALTAQLHVLMTQLALAHEKIDALASVQQAQQSVIMASTMPATTAAAATPLHPVPPSTSKVKSSATLFRTPLRSVVDDPPPAAPTPLSPTSASISPMAMVQGVSISKSASSSNLALSSPRAAAPLLIDTSVRSARPAGIKSPQAAHSGVSMFVVKPQHSGSRKDLKEHAAAQAAAAAAAAAAPRALDDDGVYEESVAPAAPAVPLSHRTRRLVTGGTSHSSGGPIARSRAVALQHHSSPLEPHPPLSPTASAPHPSMTHSASGRSLAVSGQPVAPVVKDAHVLAQELAHLRLQYDSQAVQLCNVQAAHAKLRHELAASAAAGPMDVRVAELEMQLAERNREVAVLQEQIKHSKVMTKVRSSRPTDGGATAPESHAAPLSARVNGAGTAATGPVAPRTAAHAHRTQLEQLRAQLAQQAAVIHSLQQARL